MKFLSLVAAASAVVIYAPSPLKSCGTSADTFNLQSLDITPYPIIKGQNVSISASGNLKKAILDGSKIALSVKAGFIPLYSNTLDVCSNTAKQGYSCPIAAGDHTIATSQAIPDNVPAGSFDIKLVATNADNSEIACFAGTVKIQDA